MRKENNCTARMMVGIPIHPFGNYSGYAHELDSHLQTIVSVVHSFLDPSNVQSCLLHPHHIRIHKALVEASPLLRAEMSEINGYLVPRLGRNLLQSEPFGFWVEQRPPTLCISDRSRTALTR
jgi:hypothetical protein